MCGLANAKSKDGKRVMGQWPCLAQRCFYKSSCEARTSDYIRREVLSQSRCEAATVRNQESSVIKTAPLTETLSEEVRVRRLGDISKDNKDPKKDGPVSLETGSSAQRICA